MKKLKDIGELKLIESFGTRYKSAKHTIIGIGDDAAVVKAPKRKELLVFTCDTLVEGVHFLRGEVSGYKVGWKALGAGLSDIAAMGGVPISAVVSLAMPPGTSVNFVDGVVKGMNSLAQRFRMDIVGGDSVSSPKAMVISVAVIGKVKRKNLALRNGAEVGDKILVTGTLGGSIYRKQFNFIPRIKEAQWLVSHARINAMMDITDGLSIDLYKLITASHVGAILYKEAIPISRDAYRTKDPLKSALTSGEDFELLITTKDVDNLINKSRLCAQGRGKKILLTVIGEITSERGKIKLIDKSGRPKEIAPKGYEHFK